MARAPILPDELKFNELIAAISDDTINGNINPFSIRKNNSPM